MPNRKVSPKKIGSLSGIKPISKKEIKKFYKILNSSPISRSKYRIQSANHVVSEPVFKQTTNAGV